MKQLLIGFTLLFSNQLHAGDAIENLTVKTKLSGQEEVTHIQFDGSEHWISQKSSTDPGAAPATKIKMENMSLIESKIEDIKKLKSVSGCESRIILLTLVDDTRRELKFQGCLDGKDPMSNQLNELSATLLILI